MTQSDDILAYLRRNGSISPLEALNDLGVFRLAARVRELRLDGYLIVNEGERRNGKSYARYVLHEARQLTFDEVKS